MDRRVRESSGLRASEEVLDQGAEAIEGKVGRVPSQKHFARVRLQLQSEHVLLVFNIYLDLVFVLGVRDGEAISNFHLDTIFGPDT